MLNRIFCGSEGPVPVTYGSMASSAVVCFLIKRVQLQAQKSFFFSFGADVNKAVTYAISIKCLHVVLYFT